MTGDGEGLAKAEGDALGDGMAKPGLGEGEAAAAGLGLGEVLAG